MEAPPEALEFWVQCDQQRALIFVDSSGVIQSWNRAATRVTGHSEQSVTGRRWRDLFDIPLDLTDSSVSLRDPGGTLHLLRFRARAVTGGGWAVVLEPLHSGTTLESLQQATQVALQESEERLQFALKGANDGIWDWNLVTNSVSFSSRWMTMLGYAEGEWPGHVDTWRRLVHPEDLAGAECLVTAYLSGASDQYEAEFRMLHKDGSYRHILARGYLVLDRDGNPARLVGTHVDLTEHKKAEAALRRSQQLLQRTQAIANVAGWTYSIGAGTLTSDARGESLFDLNQVHPEDRERLYKAWQSALLGADLEMEYRLLRGDEETWVFVRSTTECDEHGTPLRVLGAVQDISALKRLEQQFHRAQRMEAIGQLAGGLAHDYNNITTVTNASAEYILSENPDSPYREDLLAIIEAGERGAALTQQLLAFSRKQLLNPQVLNLNSVIQQFRRMLDRVIREDIQFVTRPQVELWAVRADPGQLEQVLLNLVINARDAMTEGGQLTLATRNCRIDTPNPYNCPAGEYVELTVSDTGVGIPEDVQEKIFQPFFTTKEVGKGSGLGLSTVYGIVHQSGGFLRVTSQAGEGSTFSMIFPAVFEKTCSPQPRLPKRAEGEGQGTILLVEDEAAVRRVTRKFLERHGYHVLEASGASEGLQQVADFAGRIDLLLTDVIMPGKLNGPDLAARLQSLCPQMRVLFMSGYAGEALSRNGITDDCLLPKPFSPSALLEKVGACLARPQNPV